MSREKCFCHGNGKRHRDPPLRLKRLVCFSGKAWIGLREVVKKPSLEKKSSKRCKEEKVSTKNRVHKAEEGGEIRGTDFSLDGREVRRWWEKENWAMIIDTENPFGDLTRDEEFRVTEVLKGDGDGCPRR